MDSRIELRPVLLTSSERAKDLLFLDLALDSAVRTTMERGLKELSFNQLPVNFPLILPAYFVGKLAFNVSCLYKEKKHIRKRRGKFLFIYFSCNCE